MEHSYATTGFSNQPPITREAILEAVEKMRAIPKPPSLDDVVFVLGDDVPAVKDSELALAGMPVRVIRSPYAKGITPLPASVLDPPSLRSWP